MTVTARAAWCLAVGLWACGPGGVEPESPRLAADRLAAACLEEGARTCAQAAEALAAWPPSAGLGATIAALHYRACIAGDAASCAQAAELYAAGAVPPPRRARAAALFEHSCATRFPTDPGACVAAALHGRACDGGRGASCAALAELQLSGRLGAYRPALAEQLQHRACVSGHTPSCASVARALVRTEPGRAAKLLAMGCATADAGQCAELANLLERGVGIPRDLVRARKLRQQACDAEHAPACRALGFMWQQGVGGPSGTANAVALFRRACDADDADACVLLARAHFSGMLGERDLPRHYELSGRAAALYAPRCEAGELSACRALGVLRQRGAGVPTDASLANQLFELACEGGHGPACVDFLTRGHHRISVRHKPKLASAVVTACRAGDGPACFAAGWIGEGDLAKAGVTPPAHPFATGCRQGHAPSCNAAGILQFPPSTTGLTALGVACELGYAPGCYHLGLARETRGDIEADEQAVTAYTRACELGWPAACTRLGVMRRAGHMTPGASTARDAFDKGCRGGDPAGCFELALALRAEADGDPQAGLRLLERACQAGMVESCAEAASRRLLLGSEHTASALTALEDACEKGGHHACLVLAERTETELADKREYFVTRAALGASSICNDGLAVCGSTRGSTQATRRWSVYDGEPAWALDRVPACGIALERVCLQSRDARRKRCELTGKFCFEAGAAIRELARAGLSVSVADALEVEAIGLGRARADCRKNVAAGCSAAARAYREGLGTPADAAQAKRFDQRACQLDPSRCE